MPQNKQEGKPWYDMLIEYRKAHPQQTDTSMFIPIGFFDHIKSVATEEAVRKCVEISRGKVIDLKQKHIELCKVNNKTNRRMNMMWWRANNETAKDIALSIESRIKE